MSNLEKALIDEIDMVLDSADLDSDILSEDKKLDIARDIIAEDDQVWEELIICVNDRIRPSMKKKLMYLFEKGKTTTLDKEELCQFNALKDFI